MSALGFKDRWAPAVLSGDKPFTLRRAWKRPERMPDIDQRVDLVTGWRTPARKVIGTARVAFRCGVTFDARGLSSFDGWREAPMTGPMAGLVAAILAAGTGGAKDAASGRFAELDGFDSWEAFWAFHDQHRARRADTRSMTRELIGFDRIAEEFAR